MWLLCLVFLGCPPPEPSENEAPDAVSEDLPVQKEVPLPWKAAAIAHGGVGNNPKNSDGCKKAVDVALEALKAGATPVEAAVAGIAILEDDPRFNAGTGSRVRIDGETVQMDASVMNSEGRFAAVGIIEHVQYPAKVALAVMDTPHLVLAGDGATRFARSLGIPEYDPATERMKKKTAKIQKRLLDGDPTLSNGWDTFDWRTAWNFEKSIEEAGLSIEDVGGDTVGVAVRGRDGRFGVALSTGGTSVTLRGRVGDVPIYGAGLYASSNGAVAATGVGERIIEETLSKTTVGYLGTGDDAQAAADRGVNLIKERGSVGLIVIGPDTMAAAASKEMAWAGREADSDRWFGPQPEPEGH